MRHRPPSPRPRSARAPLSLGRGDGGEGERPGSAVHHLALVLDNVKFQHTLFALPFCLMSFGYATYPGPSGRLLLLVLLAMVTARTAAMSHNRFVDAELDAINPRTRGRPVPTGRITRRETLLWTVGSSGAFVGVCALINVWALALSPVALAVILSYSHAKRFTWLSHVWLGASLGVAPLGGWVAALGLPWSPVPWLIAGSVVLWVAGFDVIYATQDEAFDRETGLHSLVTKLGISGALWAARAAHVVAVGLLVALGLVADRLGVVYFAGLAVAAVSILVEHTMVRADDLSRVNVAFFTMNGIVSLVLCAATFIDVYWW